MTTTTTTLEMDWPYELVCKPQGDDDEEHEPA